MFVTNWKGFIRKCTYPRTPFGLPSEPDVKERVGLSSGLVRTPGCLLFNDCWCSKTSWPSSSSDPPTTLPSFRSSRPGSSALKSRFFLIHSLTWSDSLPSSLEAFSITIRPLGLATSRYMICRSGGYLLVISTFPKHANMCIFVLHWVDNAEGGTSF